MQALQQISQLHFDSKEFEDLKVLIQIVTVNIVLMKLNLFIDDESECRIFIIFLLLVSRPFLPKIKWTLYPENASDSRKPNFSSG